MFGVGWTEMLLIGVVALIVIGPKDLPVVMRQMGKLIGTVRRMGSEFQREINKTTGLDTITDLRRSITEPLKQTAAEINREFNRPTTTGGIIPSGAITPKVAGAESVVDEIHEKAGMTPVRSGPTPLRFVRDKPVESPAPAEAAPPAAKPARKPRAKKAAPVAEVAAVAATPAPKKAAAPRKPRTPKPKPKADA